MPRVLINCISILGVAAALSGCGDSAAVADLRKDVDSLKTRVSALEAEKAASATQPAQNGTATGAAPATASSTDSSSGTPKISFTDINGRFGEKAITDLARLGVVDADSGTNFAPSKPCTRRVFIRWLVLANNALQDDATKRIKLATTDEKPFFPDVPSTDPDFKYIQAMADSAFSIGYKTKQFKPENQLTREEMIAIKGPIDFGNPSIASNYLGTWSDNALISADYKPTLNYEAYCKKNIPRIYGELKALNPQKPVTREEAAVCLSAIGDKKAADAPSQ